MQPVGELKDALPRGGEPSHLWKGLFLPGHTWGCQAVVASNTDNGYLMTGLMEIKPEYVLFVPSGFVLKLAVNGARRWA